MVLHIRHLGGTDVASDASARWRACLTENEARHARHVYNAAVTTEALYAAVRIGPQQKIVCSLCLAPLLQPDFAMVQ